MKFRLDTVLLATAAAVVLSAALGGRAARAGTNAWSQVGPAGSTIRRLATTSDGHLWAATDESGLYSSSNGGSTWSREAGVTCASCLQFAECPSDSTKLLAVCPDRVLIKQSGVWTSVLGMSESDHMQDACWGGNASTLLVATSVGVYRTTDLGQHWTKITAGFDGEREVYSVTANPLRSDEYWVTGRAGVFKSTDGGVTFAAKMTGLEALPHSIVMCAAVSSWDADTLFVGTWYGAYQTTDSGAHWTKGTSTPEEPIRSLAAAPSTGSAVAVIATAASGTYARNSSTGAWSAFHAGNFASLLLGTDWLLGGSSGVIEKTSDSGATWSALTRVGVPKVLSLAFDGQNGYAAVDFGQPEPHRLYKTTDGGMTWNTTGALPTGFEPLSVSMDSAGVVYAGSTVPGKRGILKSTDGGVTWTDTAPPNVVFGIGLSVPLLAASAATPSFLVAGITPLETSATSTHIYTSPTPNTNWGGITPSASGWPQFLATALAVRGQNEIWIGGLDGENVVLLLKSVNGGASWVQVGQAAVLRTVTGLAVDTQPNQNGLWIAMRGLGVYKTADMGMTYAVLNNGLTDLNVSTLVKASNCPTMYCGTDSGSLFISANAGATWTNFAPPVPFGTPGALATSPDGKTLLVGSLDGGLWHYKTSP